MKNPGASTAEQNRFNLIPVNAPYRQTMLADEPGLRLRLVPNERSQDLLRKRQLAGGTLLNPRSALWEATSDLLLDATITLPEQDQPTIRRILIRAGDTECEVRLGNVHVSAQVDLEIKLGEQTIWSGEFAISQQSHGEAGDLPFLDHDGFLHVRNARSFPLIALNPTLKPTNGSEVSMIWRLADSATLKGDPKDQLTVVAIDRKQSANAVQQAKTWRGWSAVQAYLLISDAKSNDSDGWIKNTQQLLRQRDAHRPVIWQYHSMTAANAAGSKDHYEDLVLLPIAQASVDACRRLRSLPMGAPVAALSSSDVASGSALLSALARTILLGGVGLALDSDCNELKPAIAQQLLAWRELLTRAKRVPAQGVDLLTKPADVIAEVVQHQATIGLAIASDHDQEVELQLNQPLSQAFSALLGTMPELSRVDDGLRLMLPAKSARLLCSDRLLLGTAHRQGATQSSQNHA